jgi:glycosyltransferase involved in cell wall biosynthesis
MKISIFTPTHDPKYLMEAYQSLKAQTYKDWEWVLQPNSKSINTRVKIPDEIKNDPQVRILAFTQADGIGALKKLCCLQAKGELFLELDHDDWLIPNALEEVAKAYKETGAGFIFSDSVHFFPDHTSEVFSSDFGWEHYKTEFNGRDYIAMRSFPPNARSLCEIYWSPNHVRVWSREAYEKVGGHSGRLSVGDDHDLICRTYLAGVKFHYIPKAIYFYRRHNENSYVLENKDIQVQQFKNRDKYLYALVAEWCNREGLLMLDLGGLHNNPPGWLSVDMKKGADIVCDVTEGIPVEDGKVGAFRAWDFLEHIPIGKVPALMNHLYDKLAPGGWIISQTPAVCDADGRCGRGAFQDPTHCSFWSENNFWYYTDKNLAKYVSEIRCRFQTVRVWSGYPSEFHRQHLIPYVWWDGIALKGQRVPGKQLI